MKKHIQLVVAIVIVLAVVWMARGGIAWAGGLPATQTVAFSEPISAQNDSNLAPPPYITDITTSGIYNVGGICILDIKYTEPVDVKNKADAEVPIEESSRVPFFGEGELLFPGCHVVHYKNGEIVREAAKEDGDWKVCFGDNPDMDDIKIYYYLDDPQNASKSWIPLDTFNENTLVCAKAPFTGVYMPVGRTVEDPGRVPAAESGIPAEDAGGTVIAPPSDITITTSGTYSAGGICSVTIKYYVSQLGDNLHVQFPTEDTYNIPFPGNQDLLYLPGCHFLHYQEGVVQEFMTRAEGEWEICFAAIPGKETTIYYYRDANTDISSSWVPLATTIEGGMACASLADYSGVYAPAGK